MDTGGISCGRGLNDGKLVGMRNPSVEGWGVRELVPVY